MNQNFLRKNDELFPLSPAKMAALVQQGHCKFFLCGRIRNKLASLKGASYSTLWQQPRSSGIYNWNITLSSLSANSFVLQHNYLGSPLLSSTYFLQIIPTRNKVFLSSSFLPTVNKNNKKFHSLTQFLNNSTLLLPHPVSSFDIFCRFKQKKKNRKLQEETFSDDDEDDFENEEFEEETDLPLNYKQLTVHMKSPRADALLSTGLNLSRVKIDSMFYAGKLLHNDKPLTKKSKNLNEGDNVDLIMEDSEIVKVKRVKVLKISSEKTQTDKICVILRAWRTPFSLESLHEES